MKVAAAAVAVAKMVSRGVVPLGNLEVSMSGKVGLFILRENWSCALCRRRRGMSANFETGSMLFGQP